MKKPAVAKFFRYNHNDQDRWLERDDETEMTDVKGKVNLFEV